MKKKPALLHIVFWIFLSGWMGPLSASGQSGWMEDFESFTPGKWPRNWMAGGNARDRDLNGIDTTETYIGYRSFMLTGIPGKNLPATATRLIGINPPFDIDLAVECTNPLFTGKVTARATISLRAGKKDRSPQRVLLAFKGDGFVFNGTEPRPIASWSPFTWYVVKIRYERPSPEQVKIRYWIDGIFRDSLVREPLSGEDKYTFIEIAAQEETAWFDDISVKPVAPGAPDPYLYRNDPGLIGKGVTILMMDERKPYAKIYNMDGLMVAVKSVGADKEKENYSFLPKGTYIIKLYNEKDELTDTLTIEVK